MDDSDLDPDFLMPSSDSKNASSSESQENENIIIANKIEGVETDHFQDNKRKLNPVESKKSKANLLQKTGKAYTLSSIHKTKLPS